MKTQLITGVITALTLGACTTTFNVPTPNDVDWPAPGTFHVQALDGRYGTTKWDEEMRLKYIEAWVVERGQCKDGYVIDSTAEGRGKHGSKIKHYYGHCTS